MEKAFICAPDSKAINKLLKSTIVRQKLEKQQRKEMFGGMLQNESGRGPASLYNDKKDVSMKPKESLHPSETEDTMWQLVKDHYGFLLSVLLLVVALVFKVTMLR